MATIVDNITDPKLLTELYHLAPALAIKCALEGDVESMNMFEELTCVARQRVSVLYGGFDEGHLHFYRSFRNQMGDLRNHVHDLSKFKFKDDRIVAEALSHGVRIPDHVLPKPAAQYRVRPAAKPASEQRVVDILEKFAAAPRIEVAAATRVYKPALSRANRQARLEEKRGEARRRNCSRRM